MYGYSSPKLVIVPESTMGFELLSVPLLFRVKIVSVGWQNERKIFNHN